MFLFIVIVIIMIHCYSKHDMNEQKNGKVCRFHGEASTFDEIQMAR